ncbi:hypothetical protein MP638_003775 [Amoeboaphelidium occidentale]|nr:hypothetical protein MP638_003775 [Amoeboaphelidium occidentale]
MSSFSCLCLNVCIYTKDSKEASHSFNGFLRECFTLQQGGVVFAHPVLVELRDVRVGKDSTQLPTSASFKVIFCGNCFLSVAIAEVLESSVTSNPTSGITLFPKGGMVLLSTNAKDETEQAQLKLSPMYSSTFKLMIMNSVMETATETASKDSDTSDLKETDALLRRKAEQAMNALELEIERKVEAYRKQLQNEAKTVATKIERERNALWAAIVYHAKKRDAVSSNATEAELSSPPLEGQIYSVTLPKDSMEEDNYDIALKDDEDDDQMGEPIEFEREPRSLNTNLTAEGRNDTQNISILATSVPIEIPRIQTMNIREKDKDGFIAPHILSAQTYKENNSLALFGDLPQSK